MTPAAPSSARPSIKELMEIRRLCRATGLSPEQVAEMQRSKAEEGIKTAAEKIAEVASSRLEAARERLDGVAAAVEGADLDAPSLERLDHIAGVSADMAAASKRVEAATKEALAAQVVAEKALAGALEELRAIRAVLKSDPAKRYYKELTQVYGYGGNVTRKAGETSYSRTHSTPHYYHKTR